MNDPSKPLKTNFSVSLDPDVAKIIQEYADDTFRSFSGYINYVLQRHIDAVNEGKTEK